MRSPPVVALSACSNPGSPSNHNHMYLELYWGNGHCWTCKHVKATAYHMFPCCFACCKPGYYDNSMPACTALQVALLCHCMNWLRRGLATERALQVARDSGAADQKMTRSDSQRTAKARSTTGLGSASPPLQHASSR
jgi:hypothetical protein